MSVPVPKQRPSLVFALLQSVSKRQSCTHWLQVHVWQNVFISVLSGFHIWRDRKQHFASGTWCFPFPWTPMRKETHQQWNCSYLYIQYNNSPSFLSIISILCVLLFFCSCFLQKCVQIIQQSLPLLATASPWKFGDPQRFICAQLEEDLSLHLSMFMDNNTAATDLAAFWNEETLKDTIWEYCTFVEYFKPYLDSVLICISKAPRASFNLCSAKQSLSILCQWHEKTSPPSMTGSFRMFICNCHEFQSLRYRTMYFSSACKSRVQELELCISAMTSLCTCGFLGLPETQFQLHHSEFERPGIGAQPVVHVQRFHVQVY